MVLFTVTSLGVILGGGGFELVMVWELVFSPVALIGVMAQVGTTGVTPVFPLAPWAIGVIPDSTPSGVIRVAGVLIALELLLDQRWWQTQH